jgi:hypothetical protein
MLDSIELLQNQTQLILFMSRCGIAATIERGQYEQTADSAKYSRHVDSPFGYWGYHPTEG